MTWSRWGIYSYTFWKVSIRLSACICYLMYTLYLHTIYIAYTKCFFVLPQQLYTAYIFSYTLNITHIPYNHTPGSLPWQGLKAKNAQRKYGLILEKKQQVSIGALCHGLPSQFADYLVRICIWIEMLMGMCITCYICCYIYAHTYTCTHYTVLITPNPPLFNTTQAYTRSLRFDSKPDTAYLRKLFRDLYVSLGTLFKVI